MLFSWLTDSTSGLWSSVQALECGCSPASGTLGDSLRDVSLRLDLLQRVQWTSKWGKMNCFAVQESYYSLHHSFKTQSYSRWIVRNRSRQWNLPEDVVVLHFYVVINDIIERKYVIMNRFDCWYSFIDVITNLITAFKYPAQVQMRSMLEL